MLKKEMKALKTVLLALKETFEDNETVEAVALGDHVASTTSVWVVKGFLCEISLWKKKSVMRSSRSLFIREVTEYN